ncbi:MULTISPECIES: hypothetical protein [unclassified Cellulophaga]|uniref:hypothetical protein n=1 Tax=unclassified Cellulophaga TaxID=2634405 RepID=UPI0026E44B59|nr:MULTISPECIES: hypothetical protein [unclassified Cellulophaga]MDO6489916.1 hypothetical protein [Cellulophaga sp. 2_MG-2023]MDO6494890.1 hypothetical protein [Cellulophaga sp. 3_MG-2023]
MKKSILYLFLMTFGFSFAGNSAYNMKKEESLPKIKFDNLTTDKYSFSDKELIDCAVKVKGTFNGVEVELEVTISDVSWLKCQAVKLLAKKKIAEMADK